MKRIAIFASGAGSNALNMLRYFKDSDQVKIALIGSNKADAGVMKIAQDHAIPAFLITRAEFENCETLIAKLHAHEIDFIALAGFLWKIPQALIDAYPKGIVNVHPALLPKYGGKGMYGHFVHEAVFANHEKQSGITIHFVNAQYDEGDILFQKSVALDPSDTPAAIEQKVRALELEYFPGVIDQLLMSN